MKRPLAFTALLPGLLAVLACSVLNPKPTPMTTRPDDFSLLYEWREGSLPPPYHYEYTITLDPAGAGQVVMVPDYPSSGVPEWTETFTVEPAAMDDLFRLLVAKGVFTEKWRAQDMPPVGGSSDSASITANGQAVTIPSFVIDQQAESAADIAAAIRGLVPQAIWDKLEGQRQQYMNDHSQ